MPEDPQPQPTSAPPKRIETRDPKQLKPHPLQNIVIVDLQGPDYERLKSELEKNGQNDEIEVTTDDVIIDGHQRNRIALELGWSTVNVWVRNDLVDQDAIEERFITANVVRRHMSNLGKARCYKYMVEHERKQAAKPGRRLRDTPQARGDRRDKLGKMLGCSGRTLDRLLRVLETPLEVQQAVEDKKLKLQEAGRVADLPDVLQAKVAAAIRNGHDPRKVVAKYAPAKTRRKRTGDIGGQALHDLFIAADNLEPVQPEVKKFLTTDHLPLLQKVLVGVAELIEHIEQNPESCRTPFEKLQDLVKVTPNQVRKPRPATVLNSDRRNARSSEVVTN